MKDKEEKKLLGKIEYLQKKDEKTPEDRLRLQRLMIEKSQKVEDRVEKRRVRKQEKKNKKHKRSSSSSSPCRSRSVSPPRKHRRGNEEGKKAAAPARDAPAENTKPDSQALALIASETNTLAVMPASSNHSETDVSSNPLSGSLIEESNAKVQEKQAALERLRTQQRNAVASGEKLVQRLAAMAKAVAKIQDPVLKRKNQLIMDQLQLQKAKSSEQVDSAKSKVKAAETELAKAMADHRTQVGLVANMAELFTEVDQVVEGVTGMEVD